MDRDGLLELKGGEKRLGAWYSNRFRCLAPTASQLDSQHCLLARGRGWETEKGGKGERRGNPDDRVRGDRWINEKGKKNEL